MKLFGVILFSTGMLFASDSCPLKDPDPLIADESSWQQRLAQTDARLEINSSGKPEWIFRTVQMMYITPESKRHTLFMQGQALLTNGQTTWSPGVAYRFLSYCEQFLVDLNWFYDFANHPTLKRDSIGVGLQTPWVSFSSNFYHRRNGWSQSANISERVLNGWDLACSVPCVYMPWLRFTGTYYRWDSSIVSEIRGWIVAANADLFGPFSVEGGIQRDRYFHNNYLLFSLRLGIPNRIQFTLHKNPLTKIAFPKKNLRRYLLEPILRNSLLRIDEKTTP